MSGRPLLRRHNHPTDEKATWLNLAVSQLRDSAGFKPDFATQRSLLFMNGSAQSHDSASRGRQRRSS